MEYRRLGNTTRQISCLGMGCWAIGGHGWGRVDDSDSIRAVRCAFEQGVTFFDTADAYGLGKSEILLARALGSHRDAVVIATKGGVRWDERQKVWSDISPTYLCSAVEASLRRLKLDQIPLYYIHKPDGRTPISESVAALERLRQQGKIGAIGIANVTAAHLPEVMDAGAVAALQVRLNMFDRADEDSYIQACRDHGVTLVAWGALLDGLLTGKFKADATFGPDDHRSRMADFTGETFQKNLKCVEQLRQWAKSRHMTMVELALRWLLDSNRTTCPLFGAKTDVQVMENVSSSDKRLSSEEVDEINKIVEGSRR